jgi:hypothetical protein
MTQLDLMEGYKQHLQVVKRFDIKITPAKGNTLGLLIDAYPFGCRVARVAEGGAMAREQKGADTCIEPGDVITHLDGISCLGLRTPVDFKHMLDSQARLKEAEKQPRAVILTVERTAPIPWYRSYPDWSKYVLAFFVACFLFLYFDTSEPVLVEEKIVRRTGI